MPSYFREVFSVDCYETILEAFSLGAEVSDDLMKIIKSESSLPNIPFPTMGGLVFWRNIAEFNGWKFQQNMLTQHARILDSNDVRIAWGTVDEMSRIMEKMIVHIRANKNLEKQENLNIMETVRKLKELLDIGAITHEEYKAKKDELMSKIHS